MADDVEFYDIPPVFQNRLQKWLDTHGERLTVSVVDDKFLVTASSGVRGGSSQHKSLEHALNHAMGSKAEVRHVNPRFATRVRKWLESEHAKMVVSASGALFVVELRGDRGMARDEDEDFEVALVLAEDQYEGSETERVSRADTVAAPTLRDIEPMTLEARTLRDEEPETEEAPTRFRIGDDDRTIKEAGLMENAHWSRAYVNSLPDSAFLHVEPGGRRDRLGRSHPLTLRHFPYKNRSGRIDKAHLRAALSRAHQGKTKLPAATKERVFARAQEIYDREFGGARMAANAPPRRPGRSSSSLRGRELPSSRELIRREEERERRAERPFEPEAERVHYAKPHHFAVNAGLPLKWQGSGSWASATAPRTKYDVMPAYEDASMFKATVLQDGAPVRVLGSWPTIGQARAAVELHYLRSVGEGELRANERVFRAGTSVAHPRGRRFNVLRDVKLGDTGYSLVLWDTNRTDSYGKSILGYAFFEPGDDEPLFEGEDFAASPMHAIDSDDTVRGLLGFLTLRPGDTDREYFAGYDERQMAFAEGPAEELQMFGMEADDEFEPPPLIDA